MRKKKAQAAMEFIMTYGWAILAVTVVIGALVYFGIFSPSKLLPETCTFPMELFCVGRANVISGDAGTNEITFAVSNSVGYDIYLNNTGATTTGDCTFSAMNFGAAGTLDRLSVTKGSTAVIKVTCSNTIATGRNTIGVKLPYENTYTGALMTVTGEIQGNAQ